MRLLYFFCIAVLWPIISNAAPLRVITGEHANFTRVVVAIPTGIDWQFARIRDGFVLRLPTEDGFALGQFFDLIPKDRISAVSQNPSAGELRLFVDCQCHARASVYRENYLVVDIHDGPAPPNSPFAVVLPADAPLDMGDTQTAPYQPPDNPLLPLVMPSQFGGMASVNRIERVPANIERADDDQQAEEAVRVVAQALGESLARGLSEGVLQEESGPRDDDIDNLAGPTPLKMRGGQPFPGISAKTSVDLLAVNSAADASETQIGQPCLAQSYFDITAWGDDSPPYSQLREARARLVTPADQFEDGALLALARLYVFLGFGREALQALDLEGVQSRERVILRVIARMVDGDPVSQDIFAGQVSCPSAVALWALLAQSPSSIDAQVDRTAVINAYRELPLYVQRTIGSRLAEALLAIGAQDEAMQVLGSSPSTEREDVNVVLAQAALSDSLGEEVLAIEAVTDLVRNDPRTTPEAMRRFFEDGVLNSVVFSDADFLFADTLRFEHAGTASADALAEAQFAAYLSVDRLEDARGLLQKHKASMSQDGNVASRTTLFQHAVDRLPDGAFLRFVWEEDLQDVEVSAQNGIAARLLELGFPDQAFAVLTTSADGVMGAERTNLLAQARAALAVQAAAVGPDQQIDVIAAGENSADIQNPAAAKPAFLGKNRALVDDAEQTRATIRALLEGTPAPAGF